MKKYPEVPQWWYLLVLVLSVAVGIGCSVGVWIICTPEHSSLCHSVYDGGSTPPLVECYPVHRFELRHCHLSWFQ